MVRMTRLVRFKKEKNENSTIIKKPFQFLEGLFYYLKQ
jgi:hypothetical protein